MKKILLCVSIVTVMLLAISCKGSNTDSPEKEEVATTTKTQEEPKAPEDPVKPTEPANPEQPVVNPTVDLSVDYYYIGDMLFADSMDFNKWWFTAGNYPHSSFEGTIIKVEKIGRVHNPNKDTAMYRYSKTLNNVEYVSGNWFYVEYATKYKVWVSKEFMNPENKHYWKSETVLFNLEGGSDKTGNGMVDGTWIKLTYSKNENLEDIYTFRYKDDDRAQYYN